MKDKKIFNAGLEEMNGTKRLKSKVQKKVFNAQYFNTDPRSGWLNLEDDFSSSCVTRTQCAKKAEQLTKAEWGVVWKTLISLTHALSRAGKQNDFSFSSAQNIC